MIGRKSKEKVWSLISANILYDQKKYDPFFSSNILDGYMKLLTYANLYYIFLGAANLFQVSVHAAWERR